MAGDPTTAAPAETLDSVSISITTSTDDYRLLHGLRLEQFANDYFDPTPFQHPVIGEVALVAGNNKTELPPDRFRPEEADTFEIELACVARRTTPDVLAVLALFFTEEEAASLAQIGVQPAREWDSWEVVEVDRPLAARGAKTFDLRTTGDYDQGFCTQDLHVVIADRWLVRLWGQAHHHGVTAADPRPSLPGSRTRRYAVTNVTGSDGPARLARLIQDILRHHEWACSRLSDRVEGWERRFFGIYSTHDPSEREKAIPKLQVELSWLREFLGAIHVATQTMQRRAGNQPAFPDLVQQEAIDRSANLDDSVRAQRGELRDSFALLAGAVAEQQAQAARDTEGRIQSLTKLATYATALVLVPGLIVALYGADITGLPGKGGSEGLLYLGIGSILGAVLTIFVFVHGGAARWTEWRNATRRRRERAAGPGSPTD